MLQLVSPLIALMKSQIASITKLGSATYVSDRDTKLASEQSVMKGNFGVL